MSTSIAQSIVARDTSSIAAILNHLAAFQGVAESAKAQNVFRVPNVRQDYTDYIARHARCAVVGHDETSVSCADNELYDDDMRVYSCRCCYREQVRH